VSRFACALVLASFLAAPAFGKDICLMQNGHANVFVFQSVHIPAKGKTALLAGMYFVQGMSFGGPMSGTIYRERSNGKLKIGVFVHSLNVDFNNFTLAWEADPATLEGTAVTDENGDFVSDGVAVDLVTVNCKTVELP
jgi:hypothetical protein